MKDEALIISEVLGNYQKSLSALSGMYREQKTDMQYYLGKQWDDTVRQALESEDRAVITVNLMKKNVDTISGYERQNRMDIRTFPIEGGDEIVSEALSRLIKLTTTNNNTLFLRSRAFKDAAASGLGWLGVYMNYDKDPICGDISFEHIPFGEMLFDPQLLNPDLSDCMYVIRHKKLDRKVLADIYSGKEAQILECQDGQITDERSIKTDNQITEDLLSVVEYWYVDYKKQKIVIDAKGQSMVFTGTKEELKQLLEENENLHVIEKRVRGIYLRTVIGKSILAYDGPSPYGISRFPFIPYWFYFDPSYNESNSWEMKAQGIIRSVRDVQDEKNKQRSSLQDAIDSSIHQSWLIEEGAVDDETAYRYSAGSGHVLKYNRNRPAPARVESPAVNPDLFNMLNMNDNDLRLSSLNPDVLGQMGERGTSGYLAQIRQKQGLSTLQEAFDNLAIANRLMGQIIIELVGRFYSREKVKRVLGNDLPFPTDKQKEKQYKQIADMEQQIEEMAPQLQAQMEQMRGENEEEAMKMMQQVQMDFQQKKMQIDRLKEMLILQEEAESDFWADFSVINTGSIYYDVTVDEAQDTPTMRLGSAIILQQLIQAGIHISPDVVIDLVDIPASVKKKQYEWQEQQRQMQMQMQQQQMQMEQQKMQVEAMKAWAGMNGKIERPMVQSQAEGGPPAEG